jgi:ribonuclease VapC
MIAVDTSAIIAILAQERGYMDYLHVVEDASGTVMSVASLLEVAMVWSSRQPDAPASLPDRLLAKLGITLVDVTEHQIMLAREAFLRFGKGRHPAGLNYGDCFSYALAKSLDVPLLFKGDDFSRTDILVAVPPADPAPREGATP